MKHYLALFAVLAVAGCTSRSREDQVEDSIRNELSKQGEVQDVEMRRDGEDRMSGTATMRRAGTSVRLRCNAQLSADSVDFTCGQEMSEALVRESEETIRSLYRGRGATVREVSLDSAGENRMTGFAVVADPDGNALRLTCSAERNREATFDVHCAPPRDGEQPAP
jgi:hypothetical protein